MKDLLNEVWTPKRELGENGGVVVSIKCKKLIEFLLSFGVEKLPMGPMICVGGVLLFTYCLTFHFP
jgi:hypothetical protein